MTNTEMTETLAHMTAADGSSLCGQATAGDTFTTDENVADCAACLDAFES